MVAITETHNIIVLFSCTDYVNFPLYPFFLKATVGGFARALLNEILFRAVAILRLLYACVQQRVNEEGLATCVNRNYVVKQSEQEACTRKHKVILSTAVKSYWFMQYS